jgi:hypothetical protein
MKPNILARRTVEYMFQPARISPMAASSCSTIPDMATAVEDRTSKAKGSEV